MKNILPTHRCFDDALDFVEHRVKQDLSVARANRLFVVHGIALVPVDQENAGDPFAHAWVEELDLVWQAGIIDETYAFYAVTHTDFEAHFRVQKFTRYSLEAAVRENHRTGHYGPWLEEYRLLCRNRGELVAAGSALERVLGGSR